MLSRTRIQERINQLQAKRLCAEAQQNWFIALKLWDKIQGLKTLLAMTPKRNFFTEQEVEAA